MDQDVVGLVFAVVFVAVAGAVLMAMDDITRDRPQGGRTAMPIVTYAVRPATCVPARTAVARRTRRGRHRK